MTHEPSALVPTFPLFFVLQPPSHPFFVLFYCESRFHKTKGKKKSGTRSSYSRPSHTHTQTRPTLLFFARLFSSLFSSFQTAHTYSMGAAAAAAAAGAAGAASGASSQSQSRNHSEILKQELLNDRRVILQHEQELQQLREERAQRQQQPSRQPSQPPDPNDNMNDNNNNNSNSNRNVDRSHSPRRNSSSSAKRGKKSKQKRPNRNPRKRSGLPAHLQLIHERIENLKRETVRLSVRQHTVP